MKNDACNNERTFLKVCFRTIRHKIVRGTSLPPGGDNCNMASTQQG